MIDEATLSALLRDAVEAIEVPEEGAERVLAARDGEPSPAATAVAMKPRTRRPWTSETRTRTIGIAAAAVVVLLVGIGIAANGHSNSGKASSGAAVHRAISGTATRSSATPSATAPVPSAAAGTSAGLGANTALGEAKAGAQFPANVPTAAPTTVAPSTVVPPLPTQVIKTGSLSLVVATGGVQSTVTRITSLATGLGGYVQSSQSNEAGNSPTASLTLRVPVANFEQLVAQAETYGKVTSVTTSGQDVTAQSVNLAAQIQALQASINQYLEILTKAETIADILSVQQQIDGLQNQLNQLQGQQKVLNDQTSYSTLSVTLTQPPAPAKVAPPTPTHHRSGLSKAWAHARRSFSHGLESVVSALGGIAVFLVCVGALSLLGWGGWKLARRRLV